jgi:hypothetical protein
MKRKELHNSQIFVGHISFLQQLRCCVAIPFKLDFRICLYEGTGELVGIEIE